MADVGRKKCPVRAAAREQGLKRYFTGYPCAHGHIAERLVGNGGCTECSRLAKAGKLPELTQRGCPEKTAARANGETYYFTGKPCSNGHVANRQTATSRCVVCDAEAMARVRLKPEFKAKARVLNRAWVAANPERMAENNRRWKRENRGRVAELNRRWMKRNPDAVRRARRIASKAYGQRVRKRTPPWADRRAIRAFYAACPKGMAVDHIIPLNGKIISGLHVLGNLQYLTPPENSRKSNHWPWRPEERGLAFQSKIN